MSVINTNTSALRANNANMSAAKSLSTSMERLSTGKRINSAKDDAAGLAISQSMTAQIRGMNQGIRNANDGISLAQTAEGALSEVSNMLQRMRELTVQGLNGTNDTNAKANIQAELDQLSAQITDTLTNTQFNGKKLFNGESASVSIQTGANQGDKVAIAVSTLTTNTDLAKIVGTGRAAVQLNGYETGTPDGVFTGTGEIAIATDAILADFNKALDVVAGERAKLGAAQNRLESSVSNMTSNATNLADARSRIEDADFSAESTALAKAQILNQASTAMLAQANQSQQGVLKLLG